MNVLDLYCGAGGASRGYHEAGLTVLGVDKAAQQNYPWEFIKMDALRALYWLDLSTIDLIHASPPCHDHSSLRYRNEDLDGSGDLLGMTREALIKTGKPYVIENVPGAPLLDPVQLCGSSFGLDVRRHRLFECSFPVDDLPCDHAWQTPRFKNPSSKSDALVTCVNVYGKCSYAGEREVRERAMGIDWMSNQELTQAIPPRYTHYIGRQFVKSVSVPVLAAAG